MLIFDFRAIGSKLYAFRKRSGMTQMDVADAAGISDRTYADIERGTVNMRIETILRICQVLHITPDEILTSGDAGQAFREEDILSRLRACAPGDRQTALRLLDVYLSSLDK